MRGGTESDSKEGFPKLWIFGSLESEVWNVYKGKFGSLDFWSLDLLGQSFEVWIFGVWKCSAKV